jgi:GntR family transcriptional regulator / MocR family aminotransferase
MSFDLILADLLLPLPTGEARQQQLSRLLKTAILSGSLPAGTRLPGSRQLADDFRMARNGVLYAYQQLIAEGFLTADRGGTRVASLPVVSSKALPAFPERGVLSRRAGQLGATHIGEALLPFAPGVADLNAFPWQAWARCLQAAWRTVSARHLAYAPTGGEAALRRSVASFLAARRAVNCTPEQVFIVPGGQVALDACARLLADPGDLVWLEQPCYQTARNAMLAAGLRVQHVAVDHDGMAPDPAFWQSCPPRLIYLTPAHQYPTGSVLSLARRLDFLNRLSPGENWLIEDDYDSEFNHARAGSRPLPAMQGLRPDAPVIYTGTFSKLLYPGLRIAYLVVPRWAVPAFGEALASLYRGGQAVEQRALAQFLDSGRLTRHVREMAGVYRTRQQVLREALHSHFGPAVKITGGQAGLHLTLYLPDAPPDERIVEAAAGQGIAVRALSRYFPDGGGDNGLVLGYGMADAAHIPALVERLARAVRGI